MTVTKAAAPAEYLQTNPARGIKSIYIQGDGATLWKRLRCDDVFRKHKPGSKPHVAMSALLWTGCRVEDLTILGRGYECLIEGIEALRWTPLKKDRPRCVSAPPAAQGSHQAPKVQDATYVLGRGGKPYSSGDSMSAMIKTWCKDADLGHLSAHVRKGIPELLAELGYSQYEIMAILGHSEAKTSEVYPRRVQQWKLAKQVIERVNVPHTWS